MPEPSSLLCTVLRMVGVLYREGNSWIVRMVGYKMLAMVTCNYGNIGPDAS